MVHLSESAWPAAEWRAAEGWVLLVPVGSTEQHGPHLPVTTDTELAVAVAARAAELAGTAVVAPALAFGSSGEHEAFAGTLSIGTPATEQVLVELGRSAARHFAGVVLVSTHGGNLEALSGAVARLRSEGRPASAWVPRWPGDAHAGRTETSLMLAVAPSRVDLSAAAAGAEAPLGSLLLRLRRDGVRSVSPNGVLGDPRGATPEEGRQLLDQAARDLAIAIAQLARTGRPPGAAAAPASGGWS